MNAKEYAAYLASDQWWRKRLACLKDYGFRCQVCGCTSWRRIIDVHHLHYKNVGNERREDLVPLCSAHHKAIHNQLDGYNIDVVTRMKKECMEDCWSDPVPTELPHRTVIIRKVCTECEMEFEVDPSCPYCPCCDTAAVKPPTPSEVKERADAEFLTRNISTIVPGPTSWGKAWDILAKPRK